MKGRQRFRRSIGRGPIQRAARRRQKTAQRKRTVEYSEDSWSLEPAAWRQLDLDLSVLNQVVQLLARERTCAIDALAAEEHVSDHLGRQVHAAIAIPVCRANGARRDARINIVC